MTVPIFTSTGTKKTVLLSPHLYKNFHHLFLEFSHFVWDKMKFYSSLILHVVGTTFCIGFCCCDKTPRRKQLWKNKKESVCFDL